MADVRGAPGVPLLSAFGGLSAATPSTPIYVDLSTGDLYTVIAGVVTLSARSSSGGLFYGAGVPSPGLGSDGNYYFRSDAGATTHIYFKSSGTWTEII